MTDDDTDTHASTDISGEDGDIVYLLALVALILSLFLFALDRYELLVESSGLDALRWFLLGLGSIVIFDIFFAIMFKATYT